jgi:hypothetical protein
MKKVFAVIASLAWAGVAVSSATPANARALTTGYGQYAACTMVTDTGSFYTTCDGEYNYKQLMKFISTSCNSGSGCSNPPDTDVFVESLYTSGRKQVTHALIACDIPDGMNLLQLGSCNC